MTQILRPVRIDDFEHLAELAQFLDTINFPNDRGKIEEDIHLSIDSFSGKLKHPEDAVYQFVLEDREIRKVIGVSKIIAHHGTPEQPHFFWQISYDKRESKTIGIGITHQVLKLGKDTHGHTEIAGIIVHPSYQGQKLGKQLFYVRFLFIALRRSLFLNRVISELLPPLDKEEKSALWEAYGRKFTGLTYQEADQLSQNNKEFIEALFPQNEIYTCLLPLKARQVIGKVGPKSRPVLALAEKNGLAFLNQIDPFDGGPHFGCKTDEVKALRHVVKGRAAAKSPSGKGQVGLLCKTENLGMDFTAVQTEVEQEKDEAVSLSCTALALRLLGAKEGSEMAFLPYTT